MRIAPTFGWVVSIVPQVIAEAGDPAAMSPTTANTPTSSKMRRRTTPPATERTPRSGWLANAINVGGARRTRFVFIRTSSGPAPATSRATSGSPSHGRLHEERPEVFAHQPPGRAIGPEVDAIVFDPFLLAVDP